MLKTNIKIVINNFISFIKSFKLLKYSYIINNYVFLTFDEEMNLNNVDYKNNIIEVKLRRYPAIFTILLMILALLFVCFLSIKDIFKEHYNVIQIKNILFININDKIYSGLTSSDSTIIKLTTQCLYNKSIKL
jgi:hypothetical protein